MIYVKIHDTLVDIVEKIESQKKWDIILDFPLGHPILHNYISLKVIKSKTKNRRCIIATSDKIWRKIGKGLGIEYSIIKNRSFLEKNSDANLMQHNFSFWEYLKFEIQSYNKELLSSIEANQKFSTLSRYSHLYSEKKSLRIFVMIFLWSLILFMFIYYFAISQTTIFITPERIIKKEAHNFIFKENTENNILWNNKYIKIEVISQKIQSTETYASTDIQSISDSKSRGKVRLYNLYEEVQELIPGTRLQSPSWIIFEIEQSVQIPGSKSDNFWNILAGELEIEVSAKLKDISGKYTGSRWDIEEGISLTLPGLDTQAQEMLYAESIEAFTGGRDNFQKAIAEADLENAKLLFEETLKSKALKSVKNTLSQMNAENGSGFDILSWWKSIVYSVPEVLIEAWVSAWDVRESFDVSGSMIITAYIYNKESVIQKLKTLIGDKILEWVEKISYIDQNSLRMSQVLYIREAEKNDIENLEDDQAFEMKATFEIESIFIHDFLNVENSYIDLLRSKIRGLPKKEAEKVLLNDPKVSNVEIQIRPFFINSVSNISNNIIFKIR